jgi:preprotein translocase subunit SecG
VVLHGGAALGGCLVRFAIVMLFLFFAFTLLLSVVGGSLLGDFYY